MTGVEQRGEARAPPDSDADRDGPSAVGVPWISRADWADGRMG